MCENTLDRALLAIFYGCGLRRQEAADLNIADLDLLHGRLIVRQGKFAKRRELPLNATLVHDLSAYIDQERAQRVRFSEADGRRALFVNTHGRRMRGSPQYLRIRQLGVRAGLGEEVFPHRLRHSIATHLQENGMSMALIQQFLGHGSLDVTEHYLTGQRLHWKQERPFTHRVRHDL